MRGEALAGELVVGFVLVEIELQAGQAFGLDAQHHDGLRLAQGGFEVALDLDARTGAGGQLRQQFLGPQSRTRAPRRGSSSMLERATRLCRMSPTMVTVTPRASRQLTRLSARTQMRRGWCADRAAPAWDARACRRRR